MFYGFYEKHKVLVITNILFLFLYPFQDILLPHYYGKIMDKVSAGEDFTHVIILVIILLVFCQIMFMFADYHDSKLIPVMESYIRSYIMQHIIQRYETEHEELEIGEIITKLIKIPSIIVRWFDRVKNYILPYILVYVIAICYFMTIDWLLAVSLLIMLLLLTLNIFVSPKDCATVSMNRDRSFNEIHKQIDDILTNLFSIYGGGQELQEIERLSTYARQYTHHYENTMKCALKHMAMMNPVIIAFIVFFIWRCKQLIISKQMVISQFVTVFIIFLYIINSILVLNDQLRDIIFEWGMIDASTDILFAHPKVFLKQGYHNMRHTESYVIPVQGIGLHDVSFTYPQHSVKILEHFSLHIRPNETVCLVGDIGSGKSTVIKLLLKYHTPTAGHLYWNGTDYNNIPVKQLRKQIGYVPQNPILFNRSIIDNVMYGNTQYTREQVEFIMKQFNVYDEFARLDKGLDTIIGKNGSKLSGGQRQLVWCLRVLLYNPDVLILDEPTAAIDDTVKHKLHSMLRVIMKEKTVIMVTHDPYLESIATRVVTMSKGKIIKDEHKNRQIIA